MNAILLHTGQALSLGAKLFAAVYLWYSYQKSLRKSALIFSIAFLTASLQVLGDLIDIETTTITMEALFASFLFYGSLKLLDEEGLSFTVSRGYYVSVTPSSSHSTCSSRSAQVIPTGSPQLESHTRFLASLSSFQVFCSWVCGTSMVTT